jgi:hypothetical protein
MLTRNSKDYDVINFSVMDLSLVSWKGRKVV